MDFAYYFFLFIYLLSGYQLLKGGCLFILISLWEFITKISYFLNFSLENPLGDSDTELACENDFGAGDEHRCSGKGQRIYRD